MKKRENFVGIILMFLIVFIIFVIISSSIMLFKYKKISSSIDGKINKVEKDIDFKEKEYELLKEGNKNRKKQLDNINNYIDTLSEQVKVYEK